MRINPDEPDTPDTFEAEAEAADVAWETPEADAAEQLIAVRPADELPSTETPNVAEDPEAGNDADRAEQARVVELDEDDYR